MAELLTAQSLVILATLTILEIVLGIDNVIFIAIITQSLPEDKQERARKVGLMLALAGRIIMVLGISWLLRLDETLFTIGGIEFSTTDLVLIGGGLFLLYKAVTEIYKTTELVEEDHAASRARTSMSGVVVQIALIDMIFAIDSVLTAVGLTDQIILIIIAMTIAILVMMYYSGPLSKFIHEHPSVKVLALSFLVLIGVLLLADGFGRHVPRAYVYFAIMFSLAVELLNFRRQRNLQAKRTGITVKQPEGHIAE